MQEAGACPYVDATGFNCGVGPGHMVQILSQIPWGEKYIIALPNAGYPKRVRNRITFSDNPKYFASKVKELSDFGVDIIGGCCGTTPEFIKSVAQIVDVQIKQERKQRAQEKQREQVPIKKGFLYDETGQEKCKKLINHHNARFIDNCTHPLAKWMMPLAERALLDERFEDIAYFEPFYLKDFVASQPKKLL